MIFCNLSLELVIVDGSVGAAVTVIVGILVFDDNVVVDNVVADVDVIVAAIVLDDDVIAVTAAID